MSEKNTAAGVKDKFGPIGKIILEIPIEYIMSTVSGARIDLDFLMDNLNMQDPMQLHISREMIRARLSKLAASMIADMQLAIDDINNLSKSDVKKAADQEYRKVDDK